MGHFFDRQDAVDVNELLEMPRDSLEFLDYVAAQCGGDFHMMTAEIQLHVSSFHFRTRGQPLFCAHSTARSACPRGTWQPCVWPPVCPLATEFPPTWHRSTDFPDSLEKSVS